MVLEWCMGRVHGIGIGRPIFRHGDGVWDFAFTISGFCCCAFALAITLLLLLLLLIFFDEALRLRYFYEGYSSFGK